MLLISLPPWQTNATRTLARCAESASAHRAPGLVGIEVHLSMSLDSCVRVGPGGGLISTVLGTNPQPVPRIRRIDGPDGRAGPASRPPSSREPAQRSWAFTNAQNAAYASLAAQPSGRAKSAQAGSALLLSIAVARRTISSTTAASGAAASITMPFLGVSSLVRCRSTMRSRSDCRAPNSSSGR